MEKETTAIVRTISWVMLLSFFLEEVKIRLRSGNVTIQDINTLHLENVRAFLRNTNPTFIFNQLNSNFHRLYKCLAIELSSH